MWRISTGSVPAYLFATLCVAVAVLFHLGVGLVADDSQHFATLYPAVLIAALVGGAGPGIYAAVSSAIIAWWAFIPPHFAFFPISSRTAVSLLIYLLSSMVLVWAADHYRRLTNRLQEEERFRKLTVEELAHRLKNKIATMQAIISLQLRDDPQTRDAIIGRLTSLSATDDLILQTQGRGAWLREIIIAELGPYEMSRVSVEGPVILLPPKLALTMALLFHELATNAAKYGALSNATGQIAICWSLSEKRLNLHWRESGGPSVVGPPTHRGFGMRLLTRALDDFGGTVETTFSPTGMIFKLSAAVTGAIVPVGSEKGEHLKKDGDRAEAATVPEISLSGPTLPSSTLPHFVRNKKLTRQYGKSVN
jgi:two-component sensor histidine kinase